MLGRLHLRAADVHQAEEPAQSVHSLILSHFIIYMDQCCQDDDEHVKDEDNQNRDDPGIITLAQHVLHLQPGRAVHDVQNEDQDHHHGKE